MNRIQRFIVHSSIISLIMFVGLSAIHTEFQLSAAFQSILTGLILTFFFEKFSFTRQQIERIVNNIDFKREPGESLKKEGLAKYGHSTLRPGKLGITTKRLIFQDLNRKELSIMLADIISGEIRHTVNPREHVIVLRLVDNGTHQFIVEGKDEWLELVNPAPVKQSGRP